MPIWQGVVTITARETIGDEYTKLSFEAPEIAAGAAPGLFVTIAVEVPGTCLRRPISIHADWLRKSATNGPCRPERFRKPAWPRPESPLHEARCSEWIAGRGKSSWNT